MLPVQQTMLQVQQAMLREINNKVKLSPAEVEPGLSLAKIAISQQGKEETAKS